MPMFDVICKERCGYEGEDVWASTYAKRSLCQCGAETETNWKPSLRGVIQDSIEGGVLVYHAICNPDGSPKRYYSKTEIKKAAEKAGWTDTSNQFLPDSKESDKRRDGMTKWY